LVNGKNGLNPAMKAARAKQPFVQPIHLTTINFCTGASNSIKKTYPLIPIRITNANEPLVIIRLGNGSMLEVVSSMLVIYMTADMISTTCLSVYLCLGCLLQYFI